MTNNERRERLRQFFSGYFHEDWDTEANSWVGVVGTYAAESSPSHVAQLAEDVAWLASCNETAQHLLSEDLGCYYDPEADGLTVGDWLELVADELRRSSTSD
jgi:hypothetical protein